ncbi:hypothetical protein NUW58_g1036 [Xylaria curta]|uniref:Uncharacterized protein n=1 Tax=Xylaria curta TaxID=42375 RepID=A0ACC1PM55_9PEZI|nr:hypothetical protein NUW58_g1036 [Xylaria curta]
MSDSGSSAGDIITFIGVPLAVLGVLPILYNTLATLAALSKIKRMLRHLRDTRTHRVLTAVCCLAPKADASFPGYAISTHIEETKVTFAKESAGLPDDVIDAYVRTREGVDKAGGYAVQGIGGMMLVEKIEGSVDNVVGLPVRQCLQLCEKVVFKQNEDSEGEDDV